EGSATRACPFRCHCHLELSLREKVWIQCTGKNGHGRAKPSGAVCSLQSSAIQGHLGQTVSCIPALTALGKTWHPEHFTCARCGQELDKGPFFEQGGQAFCEEDYHQAFSPRCAYCASPIREKVVMALEQTWHPEHFFCAHCGKVFGDEGMPYCELHFHQRQGSICHGCGRPVTGRCITAAGRRYHPEHFVCSYCLGRLHKGTFRERDDKMYCQPCHDKLFV
uniref:Uncharacterized protein n=1 Tax=Geospiza parvula TaxID=87175 RepID=A0A8C3NA61_GEOPR